MAQSPFMAGRNRVEDVAPWAAVAFSALAALGGLWTGWEGHAGARIAEREAALNEQVALVRVCDLAPPALFATGDDLLEVSGKAGSADYTSFDDREDFDASRSRRATTFLRCRFTNYSRVPILAVSFGVPLAYHGGRTEKTQRNFPFPALKPDETRTLWIIDKDDAPVIVRTPERARYARFPHLSEYTDQVFQPMLRDYWIIARNADPIEKLDQASMAAAGATRDPGNTTSSEGPMDAQGAAVASTIISAIATVALVIVGIGTMRANGSAAEATRQSADAARDLYEMQRRAAEPNLQMYDRVDDHTADSSTMVHAPVLTVLRNYGGRPARVLAAEYFIGDDAEIVHPRSSTVVMPDGLIEFRLDWRAAETLKETRWDEIRKSNDMTAEVLGLRIRYAETDGSGETERTFTVPSFAYRMRHFNKAASMQLVSQPEAPPTITSSRK